jgi:hypothetical protein
MNRLIETCIVWDNNDNNNNNNNNKKGLCETEYTLLFAYQTNFEIPQAIKLGNNRPIVLLLIT